MDFKDISPQIESIAENYKSQKLPDWILRIQELIQQLLQWLQEFLENLFHVRHPGPSDSRSLSLLIQYGIYFAGIVALAAGLFFLLKYAARKKHEAAGGKRGAEKVERILSSQGYRTEATSLATSSNFRGACRSLYLCLLQQMHEKSVAVFAPAKTNYEYRYILSAYPLLQSTFVSIAEIVEEVWFGNREAENSDYTSCLELLDRAGLELDKIQSEKARLSKESEI